MLFCFTFPAESFFSSSLIHQAPKTLRVFDLFYSARLLPASNAATTTHGEKLTRQSPLPLPVGN